MSDEAPPSFLISIRFLIAVISFFGYAVQYIQRIDMSVAIVCMVNHTAAAILKQNESSQLNQTDPIKTAACYFDSASKNTSKLDGPFDWNRPTQGLILSSYFYGYITTQVLGGYLSMRFGAKIVLAAAILIGSILTILIPVASYVSYVALFFCRFFTGVAHGVFWPAMSSLWAYWAPPAERSRLVGVANAGAQIGNVLALPLGGFLCVYGFDGGWPSIFYIFGAIGIVWFFLWMFLAAKSPEEHRFISQKEKLYIQSSVLPPTKQKTPWLDIVKSKSFWGLVCAHSCSNFGTYLFLTQLPTYMSEILKFNIKSNGLLSALPYIVFWLTIIVSSIVGDKLIQSKKLSKTSVRKIFNSLGLLLPMSAVIGLCFVTCGEPYVGVALLVYGLATTGCSYGAGFMVNYNDIAGQYAGLVFGMANTFGTVPGFVAPAIVGALTKNKLQSEWVWVFIITAGVYLFGTFGYILLGSGEPEPWASKKQQPKEVELEEQQPLKDAVAKE